MKKKIATTAKPQISEEDSEAFEHYQAERAALASFVANPKNAAVITAYIKHQSSVAAAEASAKDAYARNVATLGDKYGGFRVKRKRSVDIEALFLLHPDAAAEGIVETKYTLTVARLDKLVEEGRLDEETVEQIVTVKLEINNDT